VLNFSKSVSRDFILRKLGQFTSPQLFNGFIEDLRHHCIETVLLGEIQNVFSSYKQN
jgi:hypothetical protein